MKFSLPATGVAAGFLLAAAVPGSAAPTEPIPAAPAPPQAAAPQLPAVLPGRGLAQHDFFYAGESKSRRMFIIRKGVVVWSYDDPAGRGEISDATLLSNGNALLAHQFAVQLIAPDKTVLWHYDAPPGSEIHTAVPIGKEHVLFIQNGDPALVKVVNIVSGKTEKEFPLPTKSKSTHGQFRHARLTADGTLMVAHMDLGKLTEYNADGKEIWSLPAPGIWGVTPFPHGRFLIAGSFGVREINRKGETFWEITPADLAEYHLKNWQLAWRLPNGNTLLNNWANEWNGPVDKTNPPVQALEVTPGRKVVWALSSWTDPDLGPSTTIQILDTPDAPENVHFGDIK